MFQYSSTSKKSFLRAFSSISFKLSSKNLLSKTQRFVRCFHFLTIG
jgi:hypothetical protein